MSKVRREGTTKRFLRETDLSGDRRWKRYNKGTEEERVGKEIGENGTIVSIEKKDLKGRNYCVGQFLSNFGRLYRE